MKKTVDITPLTHPDLFGVQWPKVLIDTELCESFTEARRLIGQGGIRIDGKKAPKKLAIGRWLLLNANGTILSRGKRRYALVVPSGGVRIEVES